MKNLLLNSMSYDLHGTWDKTNKWVGPYLNAHTNLTEIKEAMNLLWRNDINPDKVVLGLGFYGRAFTATSPGCLAPGCTYVSGAPRQPCSNEISVMIQSEIVDVMERTGAKPILNEKAAVKILTFDTNQWVAYDDEDTFKMKADFAREQCLSGIMVWAVSQDVGDATYSKAIGNAAGRAFTSLSKEAYDDGLIETVTKHPQCKWTNCGEMCPANWIRMKRKDKEARDDEYMVDGSYCSEGVHQLCCPPEGGTPECGWYQHNNGKCDPTCPDGTVEVGSLKKHCNNSQYQAACCTTGGKSMDLHNQCSWTEHPDCKEGECSSGTDEVARSATGSGGAVCSINNWDFPADINGQERKFCCDQEDDKKWADCQWYNSIGPGEGDDDFCRSGCPSDRVRVAMDGVWLKKNDFNGCSRGARSKCCIPKHATITKRESSQDQVVRAALESFLEDPICSEEGGGWAISTTALGASNTTEETNVDFKPKKRDSHTHGSVHSHSGISDPLLHRHHPHRTGHESHEHLGDPRRLQARQSWGNYQQDEIKGLVLTLLLGTATLNQIAIWDDLVPTHYPNLEWSVLKEWIEEEDAITYYGYDQTAYLITCHMGDYNNWVGDVFEHDCTCDGGTCCTGEDNDVCQSEEADVAFDLGYDLDEESWSAQAARPRPGEPRTYKITLPDGSVIEIQSEPVRALTYTFQISELQLTLSAVLPCYG
jgi:hypothetical protein